MHACPSFKKANEKTHIFCFRPYFCDTNKLRVGVVNRKKLCKICFRVKVPHQKDKREHTCAFDLSPHMQIEKCSWAVELFLLGTRPTRHIAILANFSLMHFVWRSSFVVGNQADLKHTLHFRPMGVVAATWGPYRCLLAL